jgi:hypothetical protein
MQINIHKTMKKVMEINIYLRHGPGKCFTFQYESGSPVHARVKYIEEIRFFLPHPHCLSAATYNYVTL